MQGLEPSLGQTPIALNPQLVDVEEIKVDSRIAEQTKQFLAAARAVAPEESLISLSKCGGANRTFLMTITTGLSHEEAERQAQTQVQVPGASEHQTGLAIDMPYGLSEEVNNYCLGAKGLFSVIQKGKCDHGCGLWKTGATRKCPVRMVLEEYIQKLKEAG